MLYTNTDKDCIAKDPAVIELGGKYFLYHSMRFDGKWRIGIAESDDGDNFTRTAILPITQECEINGECAPGAIVIDGVVHMFYQTYGNGANDAICHAVSCDGINFVKDETNPVFAPREPFANMPEWSCGRAIDADVCISGDRLYLYFATRDKEFRRQICGAAYADIDSGFSRGSFTLSGDIVLEPILDWEQECIEAPASIVENGRIYLFYGGAYNCAPQRIGCAVSDDGLHFERIFVEEAFMKEGRPGEWNASESGHPYVYRANDGRILLYYQGSPDSGKSWYLSRAEIGFENGIPVIKNKQEIIS